MRRLLPLLAVLASLASGPAAAQFGAPADPCPPGTAEAWLRGAQVEAALFTNGNLFFGNETTNGDGYLVPRGQTDVNGRPLSPVFAADFWLGGLVGGDVRAAASRYATFPYRPGRIGPDGTPPSPAECAAADRIWVVSRDDVAAYLGGAPPTADLAEWPVHLGAPVLDGDGLAGNYDLAGGDQPALRGDVTAFWAMTDAASERDPTGAPLIGLYPGLPIGVDVAVEAFAFRRALFGAHTVYRFTVTNRNAVAVDSAYAGLFLDPISSATRQYVGTDTTAQMLFIYDSGFADRSQSYEVPPAYGVVVAEGPVGLANGRDDDGDGERDEPGERLGLTATLRYNNGLEGPTLDPQFPLEVYHVLRGRWKDGTPIREGGDGYKPLRPGPVTTFVYPGDPVTGAFWSMVNTDGMGTPSGDIRRVSLGVGPFRLAPDSSATVTFALVFAQGTDRLSSVRRLRGEARGVRAAALSGDFDAVRVGGPPPPIPLTVRRPSPNPFRSATALAVEERGAGTPVSIHVSVVDALGRRVAGPEAVVARPGAAIEVGRGLAPGVYLVRVEGSGFAETFPITKVR